MAPSANKKIKCFECAQEIMRNEFLKCCSCNHILHIDCTTNVTYRRFLIMSKGSKQSWKCAKCHTVLRSNRLVNPLTSLKSSSECPNSENNSDKSMVELHSSTDNVTIRKQKRIKPTSISPDHSETKCSDTQSSSSCSTPLNGTSSSLSNLAESLQIHDLKEEIASLTTQLHSAHDEIASLNSEVVRLIKGYSELEAQIVMLKMLLDDVQPTVSRSTPKSSKNPKKTRNSLNRSESVILTPLPLNKIKNIKEHDDISVAASTVTNALEPTFKEDQPSNGQIGKDPETTVKVDQHSHGQNGTIFVFGGKQCAGLASKLANMREDSFKKYEVRSFIKPSASTQQILDSMSCCKFSKGDKIVLSVGEHDENPMEMMSSLNKTLKCLEKYNIFLIGIRKGEGIKTHIVNYMLRQSNLYVENVKFIETLNSKNENKRIFLNNMCKKLNSTIDQVDYKTEYYCFNNDNHRNTPYTSPVMNEQRDATSYKESSIVVETKNNPSAEPLTAEQRLFRKYS